MLRAATRPWTRQTSRKLLHSKSQQQTATRLRRLVGVSLQNGRQQDKLLRRLSALWERRPAAERGDFCRSLAAFGTSDDAVARAADLIEEARTIDAGAREAALLEARAALKPSYEALAEGLAESAGGARLLLEIRVAALALARREPPVAALEAHLRAVLAARFAPCSLRLDRVSWTGTPPPVLERVVAAEAVHAIDDWPALKQRLGRNRRVFTLSHAALGGEPLAVVEVALGGEVAASIQGLLAEDTWAASETPAVSSAFASGGGPPPDAAEPTCAIFYSISATQPGLVGIDVGARLIRGAAATLAGEHRRRRDLVDAAAAAAAAAGDAATTANGARVDDALFRRLAPWCARYVLDEAAEAAAPRAAGALDAVAHFHLGNGARFAGLSWRGDVPTRASGAASASWPTTSATSRPSTRGPRRRADSGEPGVRAGARAALA
ncbi:malonyl-CoA decarboxylase [Aureococcus anophagefferens]|uniref:Malonyl-CoA decarboxylase n=1 Tax=Aureococcus anophagefferens TaxID=44056 RepID=A0ABR1FHR8_AURAN